MSDVTVWKSLLLAPPPWLKSPPSPRRPPPPPPGWSLLLQGSTISQTLLSFFRRTETGTCTGILWHFCLGTSWQFCWGTCWQFSLRRKFKAENTQSYFIPWDLLLNCLTLLPWHIDRDCPWNTITTLPRDLLTSTITSHSIDVAWLVITDGSSHRSSVLLRFGVTVCWDGISRIVFLRICYYWTQRGSILRVRRRFTTRRWSIIAWWG